MLMMHYLAVMRLRIPRFQISSPTLHLQVGDDNFPVVENGLLIPFYIRSIQEDEYVKIWVDFYIVLYQTEMF